MATEFNDSIHKGIFIAGDRLVNGNGFSVRMSELVLAALRAAGILDNMIDGLSPPATDKLWLDKNFDPAVLKEWDSVGSAWEPVTFDRIFGRSIVTELHVTGGTANNITVSAPSGFHSERLYSITPSADANTGPMTIQVAGVGTFPVTYADGSPLEANEILAPYPAIMLFTSGRFELLIGYSTQGALKTFLEATNPLFAMKLQTTTVGGETDYDLITAAPPAYGHLHVNVYLGGVHQPKDGSAYTIINDGGTLHLSEDPGEGMSLYVEGAAVYGMSVVGGLTGSRYQTHAAFKGATIPAIYTTVDVEGYYAPGDLGKKQMVRLTAPPSPVSLYHEQIADGSWWVVQADVLRPEMIGGFPHIVCDADTLNWYNSIGDNLRLGHLALMDRTVRGLKWAKVWDKLSWYQLCGQHSLEADLLNVKSPTGSIAVVAGTVTQVPGAGVKGDGTTGYLVLPNANTLLAQDDATIAVALIPGVAGVGNILSTALGTTGGITMNPGSGSSFQCRMMNETALTVARTIRAGVAMVTRDAGGRYRTYADRDRLATNLQTSIAVPASPIWLLRSGSSFDDGTLRFAAITNVALDELQGAALDWYSRRFFEEIGGAVDSGPTCESIGFTERTTAADMTAILSDLSLLASQSGSEIRFGYGTYQHNGTYPLDSHVKTTGDSRRLSILRSVAVDVDVPLIAPRHFRGGDVFPEICNMALDGNAVERGDDNAGIARPGGSAISTNGSHYGWAHHLDIIDPVLHSVDICNTGIVVGGVRSYADPVNSEMYEVGVMSRGWKVHDIFTEGWGDDGVTMHHALDWDVHDIKGAFRSYRHSSGHSSGNLVEADDGSRIGGIRNIDGIGVDGIVSVKSHSGNPAPYDVVVDSVTGEYTGNVYTTLTNGSAVGNVKATNLTLRNPMKFEADSEAYPLFIGGSVGSSVRGYSVKARGDEAIDEMVAPSAIDTAADTITVRSNSTKHAKWKTGQLVQAATTGGLPSPLVVDTDYFIIRLSPTAIQLATSEANALAGTKINLTTQGTGHHTISHAAIENGAYFTNGVDGARFSDFTIEGIKGNAHGYEGAVVVTSTCGSVNIADGTIKGAGKYGIRDLGSSRGHIENVDITGTSVASSIGVYRQGGVTANKTTMKNVKILGGFTTDYSPTYSGPGDIISGEKTSVDFPSIAAGTAGASETVTVVGAVVGDVVVGVSLSNPAALTFMGRVSATDTVLVYPFNPTTGSVDATSGTLTVKVQKA